MGWVRAKIGLAIVRACSACIHGPKIRGGARAGRMEPALEGDESDGAFWVFNSLTALSGRAVGGTKENIVISKAGTN